jgi:hypothetical protein
MRFLLTGSSARKLRRGGVNLLGGRARIRHLHPLTCRKKDEALPVCQHGASLPLDRRCDCLAVE